MCVENIVMAKEIIIKVEVSRRERAEIVPRGLPHAGVRPRKHQPQKQARDHHPQSK